MQPSPSRHRRRHHATIAAAALLVLFPGCSSDTPDAGTGSSATAADTAPSTATPDTEPRDPEPSTSTTEADEPAELVVGYRVDTDTDGPVIRTLWQYESRPGPFEEGTYIEGELTLTDGCLFVVFEPLPPSPLVWPADTTWDPDTQTVTSQGNQYRVGDYLYMSPAPGIRGPTPLIEIEALTEETANEARRCQQLTEAINIIVVGDGTPWNGTSLG